MNRYPVDYPYIRSVGYEIDDNTIEIEFEEGSIYKYFNVPEELYWKFRKVEQDFELDTVPVKSSLISEIGYDVDMEIVLVELRSGEIFLYLGIVEEVYENFVNSSSAGSFLNRTLKYAGYRHRKVGKAIKVDSTGNIEVPTGGDSYKASAEQHISDLQNDKTSTNTAIKRQPIVYSYIASVGYDRENETMEVEFSSGAVYQYYHVPEEYCDRLVNINSDGFDVFRELVESPEIRSIGYDSILQILHVGFYNKSVCLYMGIPENVYKKFLASDSYCLYLNQTVKWAGFRYHPLNSERVVGPNCHNSLDLFNKLAGQDNENDQKALVARGLMFFSGTNVIQDYCEAAKWLKNAVELFNINIGVFAGSKEIVPIPIDPENNYRSLAHLGNADAQTNLGLLYINEHGQALDEFMEAGKWFNETIKIGLINLSPLDLVAFDGTGLANKNAVVALEWFTLAAKQGHPNAQYQLGKLYYTGEGVEQSYKEAVVWYEKAAEQGHSEAQNALGGAYLFGDVDLDYSLALHWFSEAAVKGHKRALYNLGMLYFEGKGVEKDLYKSLIYVTAAKQLGNENAINFMDVFINEGLENEIIQQISFAATELLKNISTTSNL